MAERKSTKAAAETRALRKAARDKKVRSMPYREGHEAGFREGCAAGRAKALKEGNVRVYELINELRACAMAETADVGDAAVRLAEARGSKRRGRREREYGLLNGRAEAYRAAEGMAKRLMVVLLADGVG